jgi:uroporphyrinogen III methyltransferase/synthase
VVTRAAEQSQALVDALRAASAETLVAPMVAFAPPDDAGALDASLRASAPYDWVFLTSQNAVRALHERWQALGLRPGAIFFGVQVAAVGPATAEAARAAGLHVAYVSKVHKGVAMAEELAEEVRGKRVFLPRSDRANPELIQSLVSFGARVTSVVAYKTIAPEAAAELKASLLRDHVDAVLFYSPSAVHHFREILGARQFAQLSQDAVFLAIGSVSEMALKEEGVVRILTAADTTVPASIAALAEFFSKAGQAQPAGAKPQ